MSKELTERLRNAAIFATSECAWLMTEAADALEAKAAPVGEREAFQKPSVLKDCNVRYSISTTPQPQSAEAVGFEVKSPNTGRVKLYRGSKENLMAGFALAGYIVRPLYTTPQPSAGVVMPERQSPEDEWHYVMRERSHGWNACLDEFARLNKGAGSHE